MNHKIDEHIERGLQLSAQGRFQRKRMLDSLLAEVPRSARRRRRRRSVMRTGVAVMVIGAAAFTWFNAQPRGGQSPEADSSNIAASEPSQSEAIKIERVRTDPTIVERLAVRERVDPEQVAISDERLLAILESIGRPTGLIRTPDRVRLTAEVTDEKVGREAERPSEEAPSS